MNFGNDTAEFNFFWSSKVKAVDFFAGGGRICTGSGGRAFALSFGRIGSALIGCFSLTTVGLGAGFGCEMICTSSSSSSKELRASCRRARRGASSRVDGRLGSFFRASSTCFCSFCKVVSAGVIWSSRKQAKRLWSNAKDWKSSSSSVRRSHLVSS